MSGSTIGEIPGIPSERDYISQYCQETAQPYPTMMNFYLVSFLVIVF